jgi:MarR-like DNA-binding transcriptional regulator SgrR of sgrS sRNA
MSATFCVMIKLSRWRAKIVTSLLPQPSVLVQVALIVDQAGSIIGAGCFFSVIRAEALVFNRFDYYFSDRQKLSSYKA